MENFISDASKKEFPVSERVSAKTIRHSVLNLIQKDNPGFSHDGYLSLSELDNYRLKYIEESLTSEIGQLSDLEQTVVESLTGNVTLSNKIDGDDQQQITFGQKISDKVAKFGGSWKFILLFGFFILVWITINIVWLSNKGFDPYPFILLNLILSCIAALQAPVIMMSQNRQEEKDRSRSKKDYMINLKSEIEIRTLHEKVDHLILDIQKELLELQQEEIKMMKEILNQTRAKNGGTS
jgi:uncharacterized membrane protein